MRRSSSHIKVYDRAPRPEDPDRHSPTFAFVKDEVVAGRREIDKALSLNPHSLFFLDGSVTCSRFSAIGNAVRSCPERPCA